jgi:EAL domain-containing protein (putative c-di-GMP-specific phosphodiesterase class I)
LLYDRIDHAVARAKRNRGFLAVFELASSNLSIELTESMMMDNPEKVIKILERFKEMGVSIAIDDFGTGYSSLSYLQRFPVNGIKIDRSFGKDIGEGQNDAVITNAFIQLGHSMGFQVLAEGIETEFQQQYLVQHECDLVQGFHLGRPVPAAEFEKRLDRA